MSMLEAEHDLKRAGVWHWWVGLLIRAAWCEVMASTEDDMARHATFAWEAKELKNMAEDLRFWASQQ